MDADRLRDRISRGLGVAARVIGEDYDLFRPGGRSHPMAAEFRIMRLPVVLELAGAGRVGITEPIFKATFDGVAVRVGDYLRGPRGVLFVLALPPFERPLCILTNTALDVLRSNRSATAGLGGYGGISEETLDMILEDWPVHMRSVGSAKAGALPADGGQTAATIMLPRTPVPIRTSDILQDGQGRRFVVRSVEESERGWRLSVLGTEV